MGNNIDGYCCGGTIDQSQKWENYLIRLNVQADTKIQKLDLFNINNENYEQFPLTFKNSFNGCSQIQIGSTLLTAA